MVAQTVLTKVIGILEAVGADVAVTVGNCEIIVKIRLVSNRCDFVLVKTVD